MSDLASTPLPLAEDVVEGTLGVMDDSLHGVVAGVAPGLHPLEVLALTRSWRLGVPNWPTQQPAAGSPRWPGTPLWDEREGWRGTARRAQCLRVHAL